MKCKLLYSKTRIIVIQNIEFLQNREIQVSRNMRTSKSRNKHVAKISSYKVRPVFGTHISLRPSLSERLVCIHVLQFTT